MNTLMDELLTEIPAPAIKRAKPVNIVIRPGGVWLNGRRFPTLKAARDFLDWLDHQQREAS